VARDIVDRSLHSSVQRIISSPAAVMLSIADANERNFLVVGLAVPVARRFRRRESRGGAAERRQMRPATVSPAIPRPKLPSSSAHKYNEHSGVPLFAGALLHRTVKTP